MSLEGMVFAMLQDKDAVGCQQILCKDDVGQRGQLLECIGRISKDEGKLLVARLEETESVAADGYPAKPCSALKKQPRKAPS